MKWCVCECKPLSYFPLNWLRDHTSWALVELEWKLKVVLSTTSLWFLNFTTLKYALLFLNSKIYIVHVIDCEWSRSVIFPLRLFCMRYKTCIFPTWCTPPPPKFLFNSLPACSSFNCKPLLSSNQTKHDPLICKYPKVLPNKIILYHPFSISKSEPFLLLFFLFFSSLLCTRHCPLVLAAPQKKQNP